MEIIIILAYLICFLIGDFIGKADSQKNITLTMIRYNLLFTYMIMGFIFIILVIGMHANNVNNAVMAFLILGLGLGFEKGQGNLDDFNWFSKQYDK